MKKSSENLPHSGVINLAEKRDLKERNLSESNNKNLNNLIEFIQYTLWGKDFQKSSQMIKVIEEKFLEALPFSIKILNTETGEFIQVGDRESESMIIIFSTFESTDELVADYPKAKKINIDSLDQKALDSSLKDFELNTNNGNVHRFADAVSIYVDNVLKTEARDNKELRRKTKLSLKDAQTALVLIGKQISSMKSSIEIVKAEIAEYKAETETFEEGHPFLEAREERLNKMQLKLKKLETFLQDEKERAQETESLIIKNTELLATT